MKLITENVLNGDLYPSCFTPLAEIKDGPAKDLMARLYASQHRSEWLLAGLLNHCFSARTDCVMMATSILQAVADNDPNIKRRITVAQRDYVGFGWLCNKSGAMKILFKARKGVRNSTGLNQLNEQLQQLLALSEEEIKNINERISTLKLGEAAEQ